MSKIQTHTKIKILLQGELSHMKEAVIRSWFEEGFEWIEAQEKYLLGAKLKKAKDLWEEQLKKQIEHEHSR